MITAINLVISKEREIFKEKSGRKINFSKKDDPLTFLNEI